MGVLAAFFPTAGVLAIFDDWGFSEVKLLETSSFVVRSMQSRIDVFGQPQRKQKNRKSIPGGD